MRFQTRKTWQLMLAAAMVAWCGCTPPPQSNRSTTTSNITDSLTTDAGVVEIETRAEETVEPMESQATEPAEIDLSPPENQPAQAESAVENDPTQVAAVDTEAASTPSTPQTAPVGDRVVTGDWPCWGGGINRNMVNATTGFSDAFTPKTPVTDPQKLHKVPETPIDDFNVLWTARLGSQTYGNPVVAHGKVWVGSNNGGEYRPQHTGDRGVVLCFDEKSGEFLWQLTRAKLPQGRVNDWPEQGICSTPCVEGDRMWVVTNRAELMCLDTEGFLDG
ncbi:MAG: PQQ-like beta-propeller repeat protein, partial [Planctomycetes bacterium]|nr:PQQ-like beta-propeller repeat protein [Planctomycetota bacterium]